MRSRKNIHMVLVFVLSSFVYFLVVDLLPVTFKLNLYLFSSWCCFCCAFFFYFVCFHGDEATVSGVTHQTIEMERLAHMIKCCGWKRWFIYSYYIAHTGHHRWYDGLIETMTARREAATVLFFFSWVNFPVRCLLAHLFSGFCWCSFSDMQMHVVRISQFYCLKCKTSITHFLHLYEMIIENIHLLIFNED